MYYPGLEHVKFISGGLIKCLPAVRSLYEAFFFDVSSVRLLTKVKRVRFV